MTVFALALPSITTVVTVLGVTLGVLGIVICWRIARLKPGDLASERVIKLGIVALPAVAFYKLLAFAGLVVMPAGAMGVANYHLFDGIKEVHSCMRCHVMKPMGNDMHDPDSGTLAARHYRNKWIAEKQCYHCHVDYGLSGTLEAKMDGYRHLARYTTGTYHEPIVYRGVYNNQNCLNCHDDTRKFDAVQSHKTVRGQLDSNVMSCLNCHGQAHPTRAQRTPGHPDYPRLTEEGKGWD
jgi:hypothetical protein